jgi:signal transduction histidine kinase
VPRQHEETAYRIVQECVSNAVRHGTPSRIWIAIHATAAALSITVKDDGGGLQARGTEDTGLAQAGIAGMRERTLALRGCLHVEDFAGGMQIRATLPLDQECEPA